MKRFKKIYILFWVLILPLVSYCDEVFNCEKQFPKDLQVPVLKNCNQKVTFLDERYIESHHSEVTMFVLQNLVLNNNMGGSYVQIDKIHKKAIYRSANLAATPLCLQDIVNQGKVDTIVNLYMGDIGFARDLANLEKNVFNYAGGKNYIKIYNYRAIYLESFSSNAKIASVVKTIVNAPGNVLIHCDVGEHNTGLIFGILQKCYNKIPFTEISNNLACHMDTASSYGKNSYTLIDEHIKNFPCELLH